MTKRIYDLHVDKDRNGRVSAEAFYTKLVYNHWKDEFELIVKGYRRNELPGLSETVDKIAESLSQNERIKTRVYL